jgi:hypothetical protein
MKFTIRIEPEALQDIQDAIDWYELQQKDLGVKFYFYLEHSMRKLESDPYFQVRYSTIRCLPLAKYPFMIHYSIDESNGIIFIRAVFNTSINPQKWKSRG